MKIMEPIFATMHSSNFYPELDDESGIKKEDNLITITVQADKNNSVYGGEVVILDRKHYEQLIKKEQSK